MRSLDVADKGTMELDDGFLRLRWKAGETVGVNEAQAALGAIDTLAQGASLPMLVHVQGVNFSRARSHPDVFAAELDGTSADRVYARHLAPGRSAKSSGPQELDLAAGKACRCRPFPPVNGDRRCFSYFLTSRLLRAAVHPQR